MRLLLVFSTKVQVEENRRYFTDDFPEVKKIVEGGVITKPQNDYDLSRYVCSKCHFPSKKYNPYKIYQK